VVTELETLPLPYVDGRLRVIVKVVGDFYPTSLINGEEKGDDLQDFATDDTDVALVNDDEMAARQPSSAEAEGLYVDVHTYQPEIVKDEKTGHKIWIVSPTDLQWLADGCYVLGCGGGGSPYPEMLKLRQHIEAGHVLRIIGLESVNSEAKLYCKYDIFRAKFAPLLTSI
jgi:hypothetical protein